LKDGLVFNWIHNIKGICWPLFKWRWDECGVYFHKGKTHISRKVMYI